MLARRRLLAMLIAAPAAALFRASDVEAIKRIVEESGFRRLEELGRRGVTRLAHVSELVCRSCGRTESCLARLDQCCGPWDPTGRMRWVIDLRGRRHFTPWRRGHA